MNWAIALTFYKWRAKYDSMGVAFPRLGSPMRLSTSFKASIIWLSVNLERFV